MEEEKNTTVDTYQFPTSLILDPKSLTKHINSRLNYPQTFCNK